MSIKRGDIFWADLNPTKGSEINKTRPVLIVSNDIANHYSSVVTILPITSKTKKVYPFEVLLDRTEGNITFDSKIKANQIRTIDKSRLKEKIGHLSDEKMEKTDIAILLHLGINLDILR